MSLRHFLHKSIGKTVLINQFRYISKCWSCGKNVTEVVEKLFCSNCKALQKPDTSKNYFNIIGVKETYDLDENELSKKYKALQKYLHPDKFATRNKEELDISVQYSSLVNEAYKTLLEPLQRGIYMLRLRGKDLPENTEVDEEFLMIIMKKNEEVENAETKEQIMKLNKEIKAKMKDLQKQTSTAFFDGDMKRLIRILSHMKYYTSIDNQIQAAIRGKGIIQ